MCCILALLTHWRFAAQLLVSRIGFVFPIPGYFVFFSPGFRLVRSWSVTRIAIMFPVPGYFSVLFAICQGIVLWRKM